jgi:WD40 repeat protein
MPHQKIKVVNNSIRHILHLLDGKRIISYSWDPGFQIWDLESGVQVGETWEDNDFGVTAIALSPDGKKVASGSSDGAVKLWNIDTGKVIKTWTGHIKEVRSVSWSSDGGRVLSGSRDGTFRVWGVEVGETSILQGPINTGEKVWAVCYSPDDKMIATGGDDLKIWNANSGELLKTLEGVFMYLAWTSDGKTLIGGGAGITKFDTATWTVLDSNWPKTIVTVISVSPNERILTSTSYFNKTTELWSLETNQPIGTPLHHQDEVICATFSADGKFLITGCNNHIYTWDVSAIVKEAGLPSDIVSIDTFILNVTDDGNTPPRLTLHRDSD